MKYTAQIIADMQKEFDNCIEIPNEWLPKEYRNDKFDGRTVAELNALCDAEEKVETMGLSQHELDRKHRAKMVKIYAAQMEQNGSFEYEQEDGHSQNRWEQAFVKYCPAIDLEDE